MRRLSLPWVASGAWKGALAPLWDRHAIAPTYLTYIPPPSRYHHTLELEDLAVG